VNRAWARIEGWLARRAPVARASLRPPASAVRIAQLQAVLGRRLPEDLVASLRRHDGVPDRVQGFSFPLGQYPMGTARIASDWRMLCGIIEDSGDPSGFWWHPRYTPFTQNFSGDSLVLDQGTAPTARVGEHGHEVGVSFERWPGSLAELFEGTATALERGRSYLGGRPVVTSDGDLDWAIGR
jgi:cell wall assembly regulator SMI1